MSTTSAENISQSTTELTEQGTFPRFPLLRAELSRACSPGSEHFELPARRGQLPVSAGRRNPQLGTTQICHAKRLSPQHISASQQTPSWRWETGQAMLFCRTTCCLRRRTAIPPRFSTSCHQLAQSKKSMHPHTKRSTTHLRLNVAPWSPARSYWTGSLSQPFCGILNVSRAERNHTHTHIQVA